MSTATTKKETKDIAIKADPRAMQFKQIFEGNSFQAALKATLPQHVKADRMIRVVLSAFQSNPKLLECTPESVLLSIMRAASMGLEPDGGPLGQGYLVPFWSGKNRRLECQFIPGYRGLVKLARNSGEVVDVWAEVVYQADQFKYELGLHPTLEHKRNDDLADPGPMKFAYAVARFRDGERKFVVMNKREVDTVMSRSSSKDRDGKIVGPWVEWPSEMWKKTAVRRLCKLLPLSVESQTVIQTDDSTDGAVIDSISNLPIGDMLALAPSDSSDAESTGESQGSSVQEGDPMEAAYGVYCDELEKTDTATDANAVYDRHFGPERTVEWAQGIDEMASKRRDGHIANLKANRGAGSNKQKELVK